MLNRIWLCALSLAIALVVAVGLVIVLAVPSANIARPKPIKLSNGLHRLDFSLFGFAIPANWHVTLSEDRFNDGTSKGELTRDDGLARIYMKAIQTPFRDPSRNRNWQVNLLSDGNAFERRSITLDRQEGLELYRDLLNTSPVVVSSVGITPPHAERIDVAAWDDRVLAISIVHRQGDDAALTSLSEVLKSLILR